MCEESKALEKVMSSGYACYFLKFCLHLYVTDVFYNQAGLVHFTGKGNPKVLLLTYNTQKKTHIGCIPKDQGGFVDRIRQVVKLEKRKNDETRNKEETPVPKSKRPKLYQSQTLSNNSPSPISVVELPVSPQRKRHYCKKTYKLHPS